MRVEHQQLLLMTGNALIGVFLILFLASCARPPIAQVATPPERICPADIFFSEMVVPPFEGSTYLDAVAYAKALQMHIHTLNQDRDTIREFCSGR